MNEPGGEIADEDVAAVKCTEAGHQREVFVAHLVGDTPAHVHY